MAITATQLKRRKNPLWYGASQVPAILGLNPDGWDGPVDVFYEKTGRLKERPATRIMERGQYIEPGLIRWAEKFLGGPIQKTKLEITSNDGLFLDHPDGIFVPNKRTVEGKAQSYGSNEKWGEEGSGEIPQRVAAQALVHIHCWQTDACYVPVDLPYRGFQMFIVERNDEVINWIIEKCLEFREKYIKTDTAPPGLPLQRTVSGMIRKPKSTIVIPNGIELVRAKENADSVYAAAKSVKEAADLALKGALGSCEEGTFPEGWITYFPVHYKKYTVPASDRRRIVVNLNSGK